MRKEVFIALLIGLSFGLVVAFGIRTARESLSARTKSSSQTTTTTSLPTDSNQSILITTPEPDEIVDKEELNIIGTTIPKSMISIISSNQEIALIADDAGAFNAIITLESGINPIKITSYSPEGDRSSVELSTIYSTVDFSASDSAETKQ